MNKQTIEIERFITLCRCGEIMESDGQGLFVVGSTVTEIEAIPLDVTQLDFDKRNFTGVLWQYKNEYY